MTPDPVFVTHTDVITHTTEQPAPAADLPAPTAEQVRAADTVFVSPEENRAAAAMLGTWTSVLLLHDMVADHLDRRAIEEERKPTLPGPDPEPDPEPEA
jgi:hypothetical protein